MRWIKRIVSILLIVVSSGIFLLMISGNSHVIYGLTKTYLRGKTKPDIDDMRFFSTRKIAAGKVTLWPKSIEYNSGQLSAGLTKRMDSLQTTAFLVIHRDSLLYESYFRRGSDTTHSNSFSMAKSFLGLLIGVAVDEGYIPSLDEPVSTFIPEFSEGENAKLTIRHLLQMTSGIPFGESYQNTFGYMARAYYGKQLIHETMKYRVTKTPGDFWVYEGGNTTLLGLILQRATGRTCSQYFSEKIWSCIGAEHAAYWNLDSPGGMEKTFSGVYATARDYARIGKLVLHDGVWDGDTLVNPAYVRESVTPHRIRDEIGEPSTWYGLHWWLGTHKSIPFYSCRGLRGQYIIVIPDYDLIIVRLGHRQSAGRSHHMPHDMHWYIDGALELLKP